MDIGTGLAFLGSAKLAQKVLGPTADYIGDGLKNWTQKRIHNLDQIFEMAAKKLGGKIDSQESVPPKVLKGILDQGSFCDDELSAEYFGGVLASSRSSINRDDRGAVVVNLLSRLSTYQIRAHYIFYAVIKALFDGTDYKLNIYDRSKMEVYIDYHAFIKSMDFNEIEMNNFDQLLNHILFGLHVEGLIGNFRYGPKEEIVKLLPKADSGGIIYEPSALGTELFLWAHGLSNLDKSQLISKDVVLKFDTTVAIPNTAFITKEK